MPDTDLEHLADKLIELGGLALDFGRVDRITYHQDGITPESDTDHTVMLGWLACALAMKHYRALNIGLIAQFALVHDAPEVFAGDTPTLRITGEEMKAKKRREQEASFQIRRRFGMNDGLPWFPALVTVYERQVVAEARFVRALDKVLPQITDALNGASMMDDHDMDAQALRTMLDNQREDIRGYAEEFPIVLDLHALMTARVCALLTEEVASA